MRRIKDLLPEPARARLGLVWRRYVLSKQDKKVQRHLDDKGIKDPILLSGFQKSGNTWVRFIIFNYFNILINNADATLTYDELNAIQRHALEHGSVEPFSPGFPVFYRTHLPYRKIFDCFRVIYIYRNPLDALISLHYYAVTRTSPFSNFSPSKRQKLHDIDYFVLHSINRWARHHTTTLPRSQAVLCYERMREDAYGEFHNLLSQFDFEIDKDALQKSIEMSSIDSIRRMGRESGQITGMAPQEKFAKKFEFTRSGQVKQYLTELKPDTVEKVKQILLKKRIDVEL